VNLKLHKIVLLKYVKIHFQFRQEGEKLRGSAKIKVLSCAFQRDFRDVIDVLILIITGKSLSFTPEELVPGYVGV